MMTMRNTAIIVTVLSMQGALFAADTAPSRQPLALEAKAQPFYRHRPKGGAAREVLVTFKGGPLASDATLLVACEGKTETFPVKAGAPSAAVLLPDRAGVDAECEATLTLKDVPEAQAVSLRVPKMRHWTVYLYSHSHVDIGYTTLQKNVEILHKNNIREGIKLGQESAAYPKGAQSRWNPEIMWPVERLWTKGSEAERAAVVKAVKEGTLCLDAGYLHLNTSACCEEELFHQFTFAAKMRELTGAPVDTLQQMDIPGFTWGIIPVMNQMGVRYIMSWPNSDRAGNAHKNIDGKPFWWVGPDGQSKILFFQPGGYANAGSMTKGGATGRPWMGQRDPAKIPLRIQTGDANVDFTGQCTAQEKTDSPYDFLVLSWSLWDNTPLDCDLPKAVKAWNERYAYPHIELSGAHDIMAMIEKRYGDKLPVVKGDYTEYWTDGLGTAARETASLRNARERLIQAETLWSLLHPGLPVDRADFDEAWRSILLAAEHTWTTEDSRNDIFFQNTIWQNKQRFFRDADERSRTLLDEAVAPAANKSNGALGKHSYDFVTVFNTHSWAHGGLVTIPPAYSSFGDRVVDSQGKDVLAQRLSTGELVFLAGEIPPFAARQFQIKSGQCPLKGACRIDGSTISNDILMAELDPKSGNIICLKKAGSDRNFADPKVDGGLNAFRQVKGNGKEPKENPAKPGQADTDIVIDTAENGPLVAELRVTSKAPGCHRLVRTVRLVHGEPWLECANRVNKAPVLEKEGIHFGFAFNLPQARTRVDIPWGVMEVEKDQWPQGNRDWFVLQRWLDISNPEAGVTWCSLDAPLFEAGAITALIPSTWFGLPLAFTDKAVDRPAVYSWAMNNHWHTNFPLSQEGEVLFRYRLMPHEGGFDAVAANRFGMEQAQPLIPLNAQSDPLPASFLTLDNPNVAATIIRSEESGAQTLRLRSLSDKPQTVTVSRAGKPAGPAITLLPYGMNSVTVLNK